MKINFFTTDLSNGIPPKTEVFFLFKKDKSNRRHKNSNHDLIYLRENSRVRWKNHPASVSSTTEKKENYMHISKKMTRSICKLRFSRTRQKLRLLSRRVLSVRTRVGFYTLENFCDSLRLFCTRSGALHTVKKRRD